MKLFQFELDEGYPEPDASLRDFPSYRLTFYLPNTEMEAYEPPRPITLRISKDFIPMVEIEGKSISFVDYYLIDYALASRLSNLIERFAADILQAYLKGQLQLSD